MKVFPSLLLICLVFISNQQNIEVPTFNINQEEPDCENAVQLLETAKKDQQKIQAYLDKLKPYLSCLEEAEGIITEVPEMGKKVPIDQRMDPLQKAQLYLQNKKKTKSKGSLTSRIIDLKQSLRRPAGNASAFEKYLYPQVESIIDSLVQVTVAKGSVFEQKSSEMFSKINSIREKINQVTREISSKWNMEERIHSIQSKIQRCVAEKNQDLF